MLKMLVYPTRDAKNRMRVRKSCTRFLSAFQALDKRMSLWLFRRIGQRIPRILLLALEFSGHGVLALTVFLTGLLHPKSTWQLRETAFMCIVGFFLDLAVIGTLKGIFKRTRPTFTDNRLALTKYNFVTHPNPHISHSTPLASLHGSKLIYAYKYAVITRRWSS